MAVSRNMIAATLALGTALSGAAAGTTAAAWHGSAAHRLAAADVAIPIHALRVAPGDGRLLPRRS